MSAQNDAEDRAAFHLLGHPLPALLDLASTCGTTIDLFTLSLRQPIMLFLYPSTTIRTPNSCAQMCATSECIIQLTTVSSHVARLVAKEPDLKIFGVSTQSVAQQMRVKERFALGFDLISDERGELMRGLDIPTQQVGAGRGLRRMTLVLRGGQITRVDYPIHVVEQVATSAERLLRSEHELMEEVEARDAANAAAAAKMQA